MYYVGADYYHGLSGRFGASMEDPFLGVQTAPVAHSKNNMAYGATSYGVTLLPRNNVAVSFVGQNIFGKVDGYSLTFATKVSF